MIDYQQAHMALIDTLVELHSNLIDKARFLYDNNAHQQCSTVLDLAEKVNEILHMEILNLELSV